MWPLKKMSIQKAVARENAKYHVELHFNLFEDRQYS